MDELFAPFETVFAERLLAPYPNNHDAKFFIQTLLLAAKMGHLCLHVDKEVKPDLASLLGSCGLEERLRSSLRAVPKEIIQNCLDEPFAVRPICQRGSYFYLQRYYVAETAVFREWQRLMQGCSYTEKPICFEECLLQEQKEAVRLACERNFIILSGGPGTGKTFTAGHMVKAVFETFPHKNYKIALAAPTGKAASHLQSAIAKALPQADLTGQTLHSLLGIRPNHAPITSLPYDFILVDESSMIDIELMSHLLSAVNNGSKLILIGDENQLPPVEAGGIFSDLKAVHPYSVALQKCVRAELKELADFGACLNKGDSKGALNLINQDTIDLIDPATMNLKTLLAEAASRFEKGANSFCLLTPLRQGAFGSDSINKIISSSLRKKAAKNFHAPIMITTNDHKMGLFNGELGWLTKHQPLSDSFTAEDYALFANDRQFYALLLPRFEYAYCLSVHKSQGSEFDEILLILPEGSESFGRKVIYTAATRAKKKMTIYSSKETLCKTLQANNERFSGFHSRL